jgi:tRNA(adenine34) deaminase
MKTPEEYMKAALKEAAKAEQIDEVPVGAVIVQNGTVIRKGT